MTEVLGILGGRPPHQAHSSGVGEAALCRSMRRVTAGLQEQQVVLASKYQKSLKGSCPKFSKLQAHCVFTAMGNLKGVAQKSSNLATLNEMSILCHYYISLSQDT